MPETRHEGGHPLLAKSGEFEPYELGLPSAPWYSHGARGIRRRKACVVFTKLERRPYQHTLVRRQLGGLGAGFTDVPAHLGTPDPIRQPERRRFGDPGDEKHPRWGGDVEVPHPEDALRQVRRAHLLLRICHTHWKGGAVCAYERHHSHAAVSHQVLQLHPSQPVPPEANAVRGRGSGSRHVLRCACGGSAVLHRSYFDCLCGLQPMEVFLRFGLGHRDVSLAARDRLHQHIRPDLP
mmetsp:Transcript_29513/g.57559  ORF Transcript_29513/g.57559 Transcript_29513/m.57559 type:complete len:237 (-) Transcript_29513:1549-2259(-)